MYVGKLVHWEGENKVSYYVAALELSILILLCFGNSIRGSEL